MSQIFLREFLTVGLGLLFGSFLNVVIVRLPRGKSIAFPPSNCVSCKKKIAWYDNIPLFSYVVLKGKCRSCKKKISIRYPIVEALTALLFYAVYKRFGWTFLLFVRDWPFVASLVAITFIDLRHRIIPDSLSLGGLVLGLLTSPWVPGLGLVSSLIGAAVGFGVFYGFAWLYYKMSGRDGLGGGDIKLLAMLGAFLGVNGVFYTVLISSILGSAVGLGWALGSKKRNVMRVAIPYGPFLVLGAMIYYLWGDLIWFRSMSLI